MNDPNVMEPNEVGRGIETGFKMLTDNSFSAVVNAEGLADLKKLLRHLLTGIYSINTKPDQQQAPGAGDKPSGAGDKLPPPSPPGGNGE